jgi:mRNA interferase MazF
MITYSFGDVVLVPFPFTDQTSSKKRPAVVVSSAAYHAAHMNLIVMALTSQVSLPPRFGEVKLVDWQGAGLLSPSLVKPVLTTIDKKLVIRKLGKLKNNDRDAVDQVLRAVLTK